METILSEYLTLCLDIPTKRRIDVCDHCEIIARLMNHSSAENIWLELILFIPFSDYFQEVSRNTQISSVRVKREFGRRLQSIAAHDSSIERHCVG